MPAPNLTDQVVTSKDAINLIGGPGGRTGLGQCEDPKSGRRFGGQWGLSVLTDGRVHDHQDGPGNNGDAEGQHHQQQTGDDYPIEEASVAKVGERCFGCAGRDELWTTKRRQRAQCRRQTA